MLKINFLIKSTLFLMIVTQVFLLNSYSQIHTPGTASGTPAGSLALSNIDNINYFTGQLNLSIPLYNVAGRGDTQIPYSIQLEQNKWLKGALLDEGSHSFIYYAYRGEGLPEENSTSYSVFSNVSGALKMEKKALKLGQTDCYINGENPITRATKTLTLLYFVAPNGTRYELRDKNSQGQVNTANACTYSGYSYNRGTVFTSVDGSAATFVSDQPIIDSHIYGVDQAFVNPTGYLHLPNGSTYRFEGGSFKWLRDKNGNIVSSTPAGGIKDSLNREILFTSTAPNTWPRIDTVKYKGFGGSDKFAYIHYTNLGSALRADQTPKNTKQLFPQMLGDWDGMDNLFDPEVISKIVLENNSEYKIFYNSYGDIARIELPTGSAIEYDWKGSLIGGPDEGVAFGTHGEPVPIHRRVIERRTYLNNTTMVQKMVIGRLTNAPDTAITVDTFGTTSLLNRVKYFYYGTPLPPVYNDQLYSSWKDGNLYETQVYGQDGTTLLSRQLTARENRPIPWLTSQDTEPSNDPRFTKQVSVTIENGQALAVLKKTEYDDTGSSDPAYFSHLNTKRSKSYNYKVLNLTTAQNGNLETIAGLFSESDLVSINETDYLYDAGYKERHILGLPIKTKKLNPTNLTDVLSEEQFVYDEQGLYYSMENLGTTVSYEAPTGNYAYLRGNATTLKAWNKDSNTWIEVHNQFDNFGNLRKSWDPTGDINSFVETIYSAEHYYAYPTTKIYPASDPTGTHGSTESSTISNTVDHWTGKQLSMTDINGQVIIFEYDAKDRPKRVLPPSGVPIIEKLYGDTVGNLYIKSRKQIDQQNWEETTTFLDNLGRACKIQTTDREGNTYTEIKFDGFGRVEYVSNPYRQGEQKLWSKTRYDNRGRAVESYAPVPEGQTGASLGIVEFGISDISNYVGTFVTTTDAAGRKTRAINNIFGSVIRFDEAVGNNNLGSLENPTQPSFYTYNVKGELVRIQQGQQNRYFMYDSLGRLSRAKQPEQITNPNLATTGNPGNNDWTLGYTYDVVGNVITITDAKNTVITNAYDKAGRVITKSYSDNLTPQDNYFYDGTGLSSVPQYAKGTLTKATNGISETNFTSFDNLGGILSSQQITDGQTFDFNYKYDNVGNLVEKTYPSGRVIKTHLDSDGGLASVSSKTRTGSYRNYASNFKYTSAGSLKAMRLGNGLWETSIYNDRLQLEQIGLGTSSSDTSLLKIDYDFGELNQDGTVNENQNTGSIAKQTIFVPGASFVQTFKYDAVNRLVEAKENASTVNGTENWKQTFEYDRYGNRTNFYQKLAGVVLPIDNQTLPQVDPEKNRFTTAQGYFYDSNGNLIKDARSREFTYNGDDKQTEIRDLTIPTSTKNPDANLIGRYYYDSSGNRIKKVTNTETVIFVYDAGGALAAEYSTEINQNPTVSYLTVDNLGSPRVVTNKNGDVISRRDFMPFGEELTAGVGVRDTNNLKYSVNGIDNVRQRFTGYEKDNETGLDFAGARMYENRHARFTTPDPLTTSMSLENPQTFNRYAYVGNNPVNITDPTGLTWCQQNGTINITWFGERGSNCPEKWTVKDNEEITVSSDFFYNSKGNLAAVLGDTIVLNDDGSISLKEGSDFEGGEFDELPTAAPPEDKSIIQSILDKRLCTTGTCVLDGSIDPEAAQVTNDVIAIVLTVCGFAFDPCDVASGALDAANGDYVGAGLSVPSSAPVAGILPGVAKVAHKVEKLIKAGDKAVEASEAGRKVNKSLPGLKMSKQAQKLKMGGKLIRPKSFKDYSIGELQDYRDALKVSIENRAKLNDTLGVRTKGPKGNAPDGHGRRLREEIRLVRSLDNYLGN